MKYFLGMSPLEATLIIVPARRGDRSQRVLQAHSTPIGEYMGHPIWGSVRFMGMEYRFNRVQATRARAPYH